MSSNRDPPPALQYALNLVSVSVRSHLFMYASPIPSLAFVHVTTSISLDIRFVCR